MKDIDIIDDYKQPSDEEIEKSQNFSDLMAQYNTSHKKNSKSNNSIKFLRGTIFLFSVVGILSYFILNNSDNYGKTDSEIRPKASALPVIKDSSFEKKTLVQEKDTFIKPVLDRTISINEKSSKVKYSSLDTTTQPGMKDSVHNTSTDLLPGQPVKADSVIDPIKSKVRVKNGSQTIYEQDQQELEKKLLERYYHKKK